MRKITFDFDRIATLKDFYKTARRELHLPESFGDNLDALWDVLTGYIDLPVEISFINMSMNQLEQFDDLLNIFEEVQGELDEDRFIFSYFLKKDY